MDGIDFLQTWMRTPNPQLGGAIPLDMMYQGLGRRVAQFIDSAYEANSAPETSPEQASYLKTRDCEHDWVETETTNWERCSKCSAARLN